MIRLKNYLLPKDYSSVEESYKNQKINWDKLMEHIDSLNLESIKSISPYVKKIVEKEIAKGGYELPIEKRPSVSLGTLWTELELKGVTKDERARFYTLMLCDDLYRKYNCDFDELKETINKILAYTKETETDLHFYNYLKKAKITRKHIADIKSWEDSYQQDWEEWKSVLDHLEETERKCQNE